MSIDQLLLMMGGISISVIGYFLKMTLNELKSVKDMALETRQKLAIIEIDYLNKVSVLHEKIEDLQESLKELTKELKEFNKNIKR